MQTSMTSWERIKVIIRIFIAAPIQTISGFWNFDLLHPEKMSTQALIVVMSEDSGNSGRDDYINSSLSPSEEALYDGDLLKLKGDTKVKFSDFGLTNPHLITLQSQEDINIILQLELSDKEPIPTPVPS